MTTTSRLYVPDSLQAGTELPLDADRSRYVSRVLRLRPGDELILFDGSGGEFPAVVSQISKRDVTVNLGEHRDRNVESPLAVHLIQGISRGDRMDTVVQKATELGVAHIAPVITDYSVVRLDDAKASTRIKHWTKIAQSACEQCGRNVVPAISAPQTLTSRLEAAGASGTMRFVLHSGARRKLSSFKCTSKRIELLIGPEGGLSNDEHERAAAAGFTPCSLGPRILRTETATIAAMAMLQARWGDLA